MDVLGAGLDGVGHVERVWSGWWLGGSDLLRPMRNWRVVASGLPVVGWCMTASSPGWRGVAGKGRGGWRRRQSPVRGVAGRAPPADHGVVLVTMPAEVRRWRNELVLQVQRVDELFLSAHTVRDHVKAIVEKVGVNSRGELFATLYSATR